MKTRLKNTRPILIHSMVGLLIGILILHPITMVVYWLEFNQIDILSNGFYEIALNRISHSFHPHMVAMSASFALIGGMAGLGSGMYYNKIKKQGKTIRETDQLLQKGISAIINEGVNEKIDFKSSLKFDLKEGKANKELETEILKSIAGFLNNKGGLLLIGVHDSGRIIGLDNDYFYLNRNNKYGFEQRIIRLVDSRLGGDISPLLSFAFHNVKHCEICSISIQSAKRPVYLNDGARTLFYLRSGNLTKALNTKDAVEFLNKKLT